ncbi:MAG TPA: four helix bundle protein [bacterium]|nr:four helix bundle protein [bacterium]
MIKDFRDLKVWQKSMDLVEMIYKNIASFPALEKYGLAAQMRRSAVSIPSNIAEGHGRRGKAEYIHHLSIAHGSLMECLTHVMIAGRLNYWNDETVSTVTCVMEELSKQINTLMYRLRAKNVK